jgi:hypothetical protein
MDVLRGDLGLGYTAAGSYLFDERQIPGVGQTFIFLQ